MGQNKGVVSARLSRIELCRVAAIDHDQDSVQIRLPSDQTVALKEGYSQLGKQLGREVTKGTRIPVWIPQDFGLRGCGELPSVSTVASHEWASQLVPISFDRPHFLTVRDRSVPDVAYADIGKVSVRIPLADLRKTLRKRCRGIPLLSDMPVEEFAQYLDPRVSDVLPVRIARVDFLGKCLFGDVAELISASADSPKTCLTWLGATEEGGTYKYPEALPTLPPVPKQFRAALIVDDEPEVCASLKEHLELAGVHTVAAESLSEADEALDQCESDPEAVDFDVALVDVNMDAKSDGKPHKGIPWAGRLARNMPDCRIILITGEKPGTHNSNNKAESAGATQIVAYCPKPITTRKLRELLQRAATAAPQPASELLRSTTESEPVYSQASPPPVESTSDEDRQVAGVLRSLRNKLGAMTVALFSYQRDQESAKLEDSVGEAPSRYRQWVQKLRYSPIRDVALRNEAWYHHRVYATAQHDKHKNLLRIFESGYLACAACPVRTHKDAGKTLALFAFGRNLFQGEGLRNVPAGEAAAEKIVMLEMELAATRIERLLKEEDWTRNREFEHPFLVVGMSSSSVGHDLANVLQSAELDANNMPESVEALMELLDREMDSYEPRLGRLRRQLARAIEVAESYSRLAKAHEEPVTNVKLGDVLDRARLAVAGEAAHYSTLFVLPKIDLMVHVRPLVLERVFYNLFLNAVQQAALFGRAASVVAIQAGRVPDTKKRLIEVRVFDTAYGIRPSEQRRFFKPGETTRKSRGSGMGLHICRRELEAMGGSIDVEKSILYVGSCFRLTIPMVR